MSAQLLLISSREERLDIGKGEESGIITNPILLDGKAIELPVKGCVNWEIHNTGSVICYLWNYYILNPGDSYTFPNYSQKPNLNSVPIRWDGSFIAQRTVGTANQIQTVQ